MARSIDRVRSEVKQLAAALLDDVERIAKRSVANGGYELGKVQQSRLGVRW